MPSLNPVKVPQFCTILALFEYTYNTQKFSLGTYYITDTIPDSVEVGHQLHTSFFHLHLTHLLTNCTLLNRSFLICK